MKSLVSLFFIGVMAFSILSGCNAEKSDAPIESVTTAPSGTEKSAENAEDNRIAVLSKYLTAIREDCIWKLLNFERWH